MSSAVSHFGVLFNLADRRFPDNAAFISLFFEFHSLLPALCCSLFSSRHFVILIALLSGLFKAH